MIALDTPYLLAILAGDEQARAVARSLQAEEMATTTPNLLELSILSSYGPARGKASRLAALARLRSCLTVLPPTNDVWKVIAQRYSVSGATGPLHLWEMLATLEVHRVRALLTASPRHLPGPWSFKLIDFTKKAIKT